MNPAEHVPSAFPSVKRVHVLFRGRLPKASDVSVYVRDAGYPFLSVRARDSSYRNWVHQLEEADGWYLTPSLEYAARADISIGGAAEAAALRARCGADPAFDRVFTLGWEIEPNERVYARAIAAGVAVLVEGQVFDEWTGRLMTGEALLAEAGPEHAALVNGPKPPPHRTKVKRALKPLLARQKDLVLRSAQLLLVTPVHHFARVIYIIPKSHVNTFEVWVSCAPLYIDVVTRFGLGYQIYRPAQSRTRRFDWTDPTVVPELLDRIENDLLPSLRTIQEPEDYLTHPFCVPQSISDYRHEDSAEKAALNRRGFLFHELAQGRWDRVRAFIEEGSGPPKPLPDDNPRAPLWNAMLRGDGAAAAAAMHAIERRSVEHLGLLDVWEPTPFPLERARGD